MLSQQKRIAEKSVYSPFKIASEARLPLSTETPARNLVMLLTFLGFIAAGAAGVVLVIRRRTNIGSLINKLKARTKRPKPPPDQQ